MVLDATKQLEAIKEAKLDKLSENETWYIVDAKWYKTFCNYIGFQLKNDDEKSDRVPQEINNSNLNDDGVLKQGLIENRDFVFVNEQIWKLIIEWYGGGPALPRETFVLGIQGLVNIELYPCFINLVEVDSQGEPDETKSTIKRLSRHATLDVLLNNDEKNNEPDDEQQTRLWRMSDNNDDDDEKENEEPEWSLLEPDVLSLPVGTLKLKHKEKLLIEKQIDGKWVKKLSTKAWNDFVIGGLVDCQDTVGKWYESTIRDIKEDKGLLIHFDGWDPKWDEWISVDDERLAPKGSHTEGKHQRRSGMSRYAQPNEKGAPPCKGVVGLRNLGNTCFMNSTLACLSATIPFTDHFLTNKYASELNRENPLGWQGKVADEYAKFIKEVWSGQYSVVVPRKFKSTIGEFAPRFDGFQQHDSSELLAFLLDGIHEDLNLVKKKPPTKPVDSNDKTDKQVAKESWEVYLKRNKSVVVNLFQGQLKSKLTCPKCDKVSVTFDPYMFLSVPLPTVSTKVQAFTYVPRDPKSPLIKCKATIKKEGNVKDFKESVHKLLDVDPWTLAVSDVYSKRVYSFLGNHKSVENISENDDIYVYEVPEFEKPDEKKAPEEEDDDGYSYARARRHVENTSTQIPVQIICKKIVPNPNYDPEYSNNAQYKSEAFGIPLVVGINNFNAVEAKANTFGSIRAKVRAAVKPFLKDGADDDAYTIHVMDDDCNNCYRCRYIDDCSGCELKGEEENDEDEVFEVQKDIAFAIHWKLDDYEQFWDKKRATEPEVHGSCRVGKTKKKGLELTSCIQNFTVEETLDKKDAWYCPRCKDFVEANKKLDIWSTPEILVVHLKRFAYTKQWRDRLDTFVNFPIDGLDMSAYTKGSDGEDLYDLYAVSNHMGGMGGGHYTAGCKSISGQWYEHDDSHISKIDPESLVSSSAYVLYYRRRSKEAQAIYTRNAKKQTSTKAQEKPVDVNKVD